jgi:outer membrane protein insertion porin family/translocation and assembly module TamA
MWFPHSSRAPFARGLRWHSIGVLLLAVGSRLLAAQSTSPEKTSSPEVLKLSVTGVRHVDHHDLDKSISTQASRCNSPFLLPFCLVSKSPIFVEKHYLDRKEFQLDVLRIRVYYWRAGYREATVDTSVTPHGKGVYVTFHVNEGEPTIVSALRIDYDSTLITAKQRSRLAILKVGKPLNLNVLDTMRLNFQSQMWQRGYADAIVDTAISVNDSLRRAAVALRVFPNWPTTVGSIQVLGNQRVATQTVLNMLLLRPGHPFNRDDMLESQRTLYSSNLFRLASILPPTGDSIKHIEIQVVEAPLHDARIGAGFDNVNFARVEAGYSAHNLLGGGRRLDITGSLANLFANNSIFAPAMQDIVNVFGSRDIFLQPTWGASIDFLQPSFMRRPENQAGFGVFAHRRAEAGIFIDRGYGATATFTRQLTARAPASLTYQYEVTRVEAGDVYFCVNYGVCDTTTISVLRSHQTLSPLTFTAFVDRSDQPFTPTKGYVARIDLQSATRYTLSDYRYNRALVDAAAYWHPSLRQEVLASHLRLGVVRAMTSANGDTVLHPRTRFYAGGAMSVRGYGENQLGPRVLTISDASMRSYVNSNGDTVVTCPLTTPITACDPNKVGKSSAFVPRPTGGTSVIEGSVELRVPLMHRLDGAVFVDAAVVGNGSFQGLKDVTSLTNFGQGTGAITPGVGVRYNSPVGPIRVDFGYNPRLTENLPVVTNDLVNGVPKLVALPLQRTWTDGRNTFLGHLVLHLSIGQAY